MVLAVQDTTEFNLSHLHATEGLGYGTGGNERGFMMHSLLAVIRRNTNRVRWRAKLRKLAASRSQDLNRTCMRPPYRASDTTDARFVK